MFVNYLLIGALVQLVILIERHVIRKVMTRVYGGLFEDDETWNFKDIMLVALGVLIGCTINILIWPLAIVFEIILIFHYEKYYK